MIAFLEYYGRRHDWEKITEVLADGGKARAHFGQAFNIWRVIDSLRNALHSLQSGSDVTPLSSIVDPDCVVRESKPQGGGVLGKETRPLDAGTSGVNEASADRCKEKGNEAFKTKRYAAAYGWYTAALSSTGMPEKREVMYSNRSGAALKLGALLASKSDAEKCVSLNKNFVKGYTRLGAVYMALGERTEALKAYETALR